MGLLRRLIGLNNMTIKKITNKKKTKTIISLGIIVLFLLIIFLVFLRLTILRQPAVMQSRGILCTEEVKFCADGSSVKREAPNCEFAKCPELIVAYYPENLSAVYISPVEWPPKISLSPGIFSCPETPAESSLPSRTAKRLVDNRLYCVEAASEGAAGSVYTNYIYTTQKNDQLLKFKFVLRYPQCDNYEDPNKTECKTERETFNLDGVIDRIAAGVQIN